MIGSTGEKMVVTVQGSLPGDSGETDGFARLLLDSTGEGIYGIDLEGNATFANPACLRLLGFETDVELLGRNMHELVHHTRPNGDAYPMTDCRIYKAFREGEGVHVDDEVMWCADGSSFPVEYWSYPMVQDGKTVGSVLTFLDITERKRAEKKLRDSERRVRLLLDSTGEGIYGIDLEGNATFANPACLRLLGFETDVELLGRNMHELVHHTRPNGDAYPMTDCRIYRAFREGEGVHVDDEVMWRADGSNFPVEYWSYPMVRDDIPVGSVLTFVDITNRKLLEAKLRAEHARSERLLLNVLPAEIARQLQIAPGKKIAEQFDEVTVMFADVVGFTPLSARLGPDETVDLLNEVFTAFDRLADRYEVEKIRTIGDGYMVAAGAPVRRPDHCEAIARMAIDMVSWMREKSTEDGLRLQIRIGMNTGEAVGAIVGTSRFHYDLWGDAVNLASRMESMGAPGRIHVGEGAWSKLRDSFEFEERGLLNVKGMGTLPTWFLESSIP